MATNTFTFKSPAEMQAWGKKWAESLKPADVVALIGGLGAGKTTLVQSIAAAWGYARGANSPTFALANEYETPRGMIYHMDMYRLSPAEAAAFPLEDYWSRGLCLVEWADRVKNRWPQDILEVQIRIAGPTRRVLYIKTKKRGASHV